MASFPGSSKPNWTLYFSSCSMGGKCPGECPTIPWAQVTREALLKGMVWGPITQVTWRKHTSRAAGRLPHVLGGTVWRSHLPVPGILKTNKKICHVGGFCCLYLLQNNDTINSNSKKGITISKAFFFSFVLKSLLHFPLYFPFWQKRCLTTL